MSPTLGYGAQPDWKYLRHPLFCSPVFLEALAEYYFPGADFSTTELNPILNNIRKFAIKADSNYFDKKGTPEAIKYVLTSLFEMDYNTTKVNYSSPGIIVIIGNVNDNYKSFLNEYVYPAGVIVNYQAP